MHANFVAKKLTFVDEYDIFQTAIVEQGPVDSFIS